MRYIWILFLLGGCANPDTSGGAAAADHPAVTAARLHIQPAYPAAARIPVYIVPDTDRIGWVYHQNIAVVNVAYINQTDKIEFGCAFLVHEYRHKLQGRAYYEADRTRGELEALADSVECLKIFGAPQYLISYYAQADGTHNAAATRSFYN